MLEIIKIAALVEMVTQKMAFTTERVDQECPQLTQNIFGCVSNKASAGGPVPMDVGVLAGDWLEENGWSDSVWNEVDDASVSGTGLCHMCGGLGHFSRGDGGTAAEARAKERARKARDSTRRAMAKATATKGLARFVGRCGTERRSARTGPSEP